MILKHSILPLFIGITAITLPHTSQATTAWQGQADYNQAPTGNGNADTISAFDSYDFGGGVLLLKNVDFGSAANGTVVDGFFQTYVNSHTLNSTGIASPSLNISGAGNGYELTLAASFSATVVASNAFSVSIDNITGNAALYFDNTPDYNFTGDSGFNDGDVLLSSQFAGGSGLLSPLGFGAAQLNLLVASSDGNVYGPGTIGAAAASFLLDASNLTLLNGIGSVGGSAVSADDLLFAVDGNMQLIADQTTSPIPLPMSVWLFGSALMGLFSVKRFS